MNKELTPLEALKDLREVKGWNDKELNKRLDIIETKLKDYEELEEQLGFDSTIFKQDFETLMTEHKALEIIKEKKVNIFTFYECCRWYNPSSYNDSIGCPINCELTQEEWELLKEVL